MLEKEQYAIFYKYTMISKFYDSLDNIKRALFINYGFLAYQKQQFLLYNNINPELKSIHIPKKYLTSSSNTYDDGKHQIRKLVDEKWIDINFDFDYYYKYNLTLIDIAAEYGYAVKETFKYLVKSNTDKYILVYIPDEYRVIKFKSYKNLKESNKIKNIIDNLEYKVKRITRHGKTAITINNVDELMPIIKQLNYYEYFLVYYDGNKIKKLDERFFKMMNIIK